MPSTKCAYELIDAKPCQSRTENSRHIGKDRNEVAWIRRKISNLFVSYLSTKLVILFT